MQSARAVLRLGDRVVFDGAEHTVAGLAGTSVRLVSVSGQPSVVLLSHLLASPDFELVGSSPRTRLAGIGLLEELPDEVLQRAKEWERHVIEVDTGRPPGADHRAPQPDGYDPSERTVRQREAAKAAELTAAGRQTSAETVKRMRRRYRAQGLWGLVDKRVLREVGPYGRADPRLVDAVATAIDNEQDRSTGTKTRLRRRVEESLVAEHGAGAVAMPSPATFNRLVEVMDRGRHTFGDATTRRTQANRPPTPFTRTSAARPGEVVQIDSTPLDVMAVLDDGVVGRVELTACVDVATRSLCDAVLRPVATKAVDAALLLARMLVPAPLRPGWPEALAMAHSQLPYARLVSLDSRLEQAAARPVIVPETIACDRGKVFLSDTFLSACQTLGISVQPARALTPTDKAIVERTFASVNSLLGQHLAGYTGRSVAHRGADVEADAVWALADLQDLLDEWVVVGWQNRPHEGLRHPRTPGLELSPNEMYAALVSVAGYVPVVLSGDDYIELLPVAWRAINYDGIRIDYRTYDSPDLGPYRRQPSPTSARKGLWEVHHDPCDLSRVWARRPEGGFVTATWSYLASVGAPFADFTWRQARRIAAARGEDSSDQATLARILDELLHRAQAGPGPADRATVLSLARERSAASLPLRPAPAPADQEANGEDAEVIPLVRAGGDEGGVVPFGVFDPDAQGDYG